MSCRARLGFVAVLVITVSLISGCGGDDSPDEPSPPDSPAEAPTEPPAEPEDGQPAETTPCANEEDGFVVHYPADWHTNSGEVATECSYFNPEPFEVPEATEFFGAAIDIRREPADLEAIAGEDPATRVVESEEVQVAGRPAVRRETEATGRALLPEGTRTYQYLVDVDGETLVLATHDLDDHHFAQAREVLDDMAATLELIR